MTDEKFIILDGFIILELIHHPGRIHHLVHLFTMIIILELIHQSTVSTLILSPFFK